MVALRTGHRRKVVSTVPGISECTMNEYIIVTEFLI
jgi:hypothetical protein